MITQRTLTASLIAGVMASAAWMGIAIGHAAPSSTVEVDGHEIPTCQMEDGSDAVSLPCVWTNPHTGKSFLTFADHSLPIQY